MHVIVDIVDVVNESYVWSMEYGLYEYVIRGYSVCTENGNCVEKYKLWRYNNVKSSGTYAPSSDYRYQNMLDT